MCFSFSYHFENFQVLLIGGSTGTMLEALQVVGDSDDHEYSLTEVRFMNFVSFLLFPCFLSLSMLWYTELF